MNVVVCKRSQYLFDAILFFTDVETCEARGIDGSYTPVCLLLDYYAKYMFFTYSNYILLNSQETTNSLK